MNPIDNDFYISSGKATLTAVSCYTTALCVAVDGQGDVLAGEPRTSAGATPPTIGGSAGNGSENPATPTMPTNTPAPGPTAGSPVAPTPSATSVEAGLAALLALLRTHIDRHPPSAAAPIEISFAAPQPGVLVVEILANVNGKQRRVAVLTARFGAAKNRRLTWQLTPAGRALTRTRRRVQLTMTATFTPRGQTAIKRSSTALVNPDDAGRPT